MVVRNETKLSAKEAYDSLIQITRKNYYSRYIFFMLVFIFGIVIVSVSAFNKNATDTMVIGFIFIIVAILFVAMNVTTILRTPKMVRKKNAEIEANGVFNSFIFKEESFLLNININQKITKLDLPYTSLKKIIEYDDKILFMLSPTEVFICKKDGFNSLKEMEVFFYGLAKHKTKIKKKLSKN
ncbi:MAG: hypothetical protein K2I42_04900 [Anaeroplasmataceae bacterium]|nr:hypothetical protein [Anaeroplasmataceae bacterium]